MAKITVYTLQFFKILDRFENFYNKKKGKWKRKRQKKEKVSFLPLESIKQLQCGITITILGTRRDLLGPQEADILRMTAQKEGNNHCV